MDVVVKMIIAAIASLMGCDVPFFRFPVMYEVTVYTPRREQGVVIFLEVDGTYGQIRQKGMRMLVRSRVGIQQQHSISDVGLYVIYNNNISEIPADCDDFPLEASPMKGCYVDLKFFCVLTDNTLEPAIGAWESRFTVADYSLHVHCLVTGVSRIIKVAVDDRLSDLYIQVRRAFGIVAPRDGDILLTSEVEYIPIVIDGRPLVRNELPNGTNLYLRGDPLSSAKDLRYVEIRFPSSGRRTGGSTANNTNRSSAEPVGRDRNGNSPLDEAQTNHEVPDTDVTEVAVNESSLATLGSVATLGSSPSQEESLASFTWGLYCPSLGACTVL